MPMVVMVFDILVHVTLCYVFVNRFKMDIIGLAYAQVTQNFLMMLPVWLYGYCSSQTNRALAPIITRESFTGW